MNIRKANTEDAARIFSFVKEAVNKMDGQGIKQWDEFYPTQDDFENDASKNQLYIAEINGKPAACFTLNKDCDEEYKNGSWVHTGDNYIVIHRLCVNPEFQNQGLGRKVCIEIENLVKPQGIKSIKLDCFAQNPYSQKLYHKLGYSDVGFADWRKGRFILMEKVI